MIDIEEKYPEIKEFDISDIEYEVVPREYRNIPKSKFMDNEITRLLLADETLSFKGEKRLDTFARWAKFNGHKLHRKVIPGHTLAWLTKNDEE